MSKTGVYKYDKVTGEVVKISHRTPNVCVFDCTCPEGGYYSHNLAPDPKHPVFVESRSHKRRILASRGLRECHSDISGEV
jgi:hypothetical protein